MTSVENEKKVLVNTVLHWRINRVLPSIDELTQYTDLDHDEIAEILQSQTYKDYCTEKGVPLDEDAKLSVRQIQAITVVMNAADGRPLQYKLEEAGISADTWHNWMRQPAFRSAVESLGASNVKDSFPIITQQLANKAMAGNVQSAQFLFEVTGHYRPKDNSTDPAALFGVVLEVLSRVLAKDPDKLIAISDELEQRVVKGELA